MFFFVVSRCCFTAVGSLWNTWDAELWFGYKEKSGSGMLFLLTLQGSRNSEIPSRNSQRSIVKKLQSVLFDLSSESISALSGERDGS